MITHSFTTTYCKEIIPINVYVYSNRYNMIKGRKRLVKRKTDMTDKDIKRDIILSNNSTRAGFTWFFPKKEAFLFFHKKDITVEDISHEVYHLCERVCKRKWFGYKTNEENRAILHGLLTQHIYDLIYSYKEN